MVWAPAVFIVTEKVPVPLASMPLTGKTALASELVNATGPLKVLTRPPEASRAVTVILKGVPAVAVVVTAVTEKCVATGGADGPPPQPLRRVTVQIEIRNKRDFFMTPLETRIRSARARFGVFLRTYCLSPETKTRM